MHFFKFGDTSKQISSFAWIIAATISLLLCFVQLGAMASLMAGRVGFPAVFPVAVLLSGVTGFLLLKNRGTTSSEMWTAAALMFFLLGASLALSAFFFDFSWDGQWYHQSAIINIAQRWNPIADPMHNISSNLNIWLRSYAKGPWYVAAAVWATTGHIETGKAINWLALSATFFAVFGACLDCGMRPRHAMGIALIVAINPIAISEATTFMVDAVMISFLVVASAAIFTCLHRPSAPVIIAGIAGAIVTINAKFTGLVYLSFALAAAAIWCVIWRRRWFPKLAAASFGTIVLATCAWGYNPYVTNTYYFHQPFYPIMGSVRHPSLDQQNKDGNEKFETPKNMMGRSSPVRFFYAIFSHPGNEPYFPGKNTSLMLPFMAVPADLLSYRYHEIRVAGFGPWFSGCLILSLILGISMLIGPRPSRWLLLLMVLTIAASLTLSRHLWWARFGPQMWLLPILPVAFAFRHEVAGYRLIFARVLLCLLIANAAIVAAVQLGWDTQAAFALRSQMRQMKESGSDYDVQTNYFVDCVKTRLLEAGVKFHDVGAKQLPGGQELLSVVEPYPRAIHYRPSADASSSN